MKSTEDKEGCMIRGLQWLTVKLNLLEDGATPPRWKYMMIIFACFLANTFCSMVASPFLPEMILHLGKSENEKGTYVGLMTSCVFAGVFLGSMFWGWLADKKGRKIVLLLSLVFTSLGTTAFSLSLNIPMAMAMRFLSGLLNGIATTCRAVLYDISDNTNQAIGMAMLAFSWGAGMLSGSLVGGFLAEPCTRWPVYCSKDSIFGRFPFLLPAIIPALTSLFVAVLVFLKFEETLIEPSSPGPDDINNENTKDDCSKHQTDICSTTPLKPRNGRDIKPPFSTDNDSNRALDVPTQFILQSRSVTSLHPEADVSIWLGKDVLERRNILYRDELNDDVEPKALTASYPDIGKRVRNGTTPQLCLFDLELVVELPNAQSLNTTDKNWYRRSYSYAGYVSENTTNGNHYKLHDGAFYNQIKNTSQQSNNERNSTSEHKSVPLLEICLRNGDEELNICTGCETCFKISCPAACVNTSLHRLFRLSDVWSTVCLYFVLCFATIGTEDIFPVFASTSSDNGGLGFSTSEIGTALGLISVPLLVLQLKIYPFLVARLRIRKTYILMALVCLIDSQALPMLKTLNSSPTWLWSLLIVLQTTFRIATNCCFASASLLINNSVPQCLAGQANGVSMTSSAVGRFIAPIAAGSLYSWSITYGQFIGAPFDAGFPFFLFGMFYGVSLLQCLVINTDLEKQKK